ncbi:MAG: hypothetical protein WBC44_14255 [Planctomycetaceae bacterium]
MTTASDSTTLAGSDLPSPGHAAAEERPSGARTPRWLRTTPAFPLLVLPVAVLLLAFATRPLWHTDLWGHLAYGRLIWETKSLPATEPLMPLSRGIEFVDTAWLSQVIGYLTLERFGLPGLQFLAAACLATTAAILAWRGYRKTGSVAFTWLGLAAFIWLSWKQLLNGADDSVVIRPQLAGLVAFAITLAVVVGRPSRWHWVVIPATFAAWANLHGSFLAGLALLATFALGRGGDILRRTDKFAAIVRSWSFWRLVLLTELAAVAVLLNPYGLRLFADVWLFGKHANLDSIVEWQPLTLQMTQGQAAAGVSLALLFLYRMTPRRIGTGEVLALLLFGGLTLWTSRMIVWFAPLAAYCVMLHGAAVWNMRRSPTPTSASAVPRALWTVAAIGVAWIGFALTPFAQRLAYGARPQDDRAISLQTPTGAARHLAEEPPVGQVFNTYELGDFLLWTNPGLPVFVAGHAHLVPTEVWQDYTSMIRGGSGWQAALERYGVNTVVLDIPERQILIDQLTDDPEWTRSYQDRNSAVFRRNTPLR